MGLAEVQFGIHDKQKSRYMIYISTTRLENHHLVLHLQTAHLPRICRCIGYIARWISSSRKLSITAKVSSAAMQDFEPGDTTAQKAQTSHVFLDHGRQKGCCRGAERTDMACACHIPRHISLLPWWRTTADSIDLIDCRHIPPFPLLVAPQTLPSFLELDIVL